MHYKVVYKVEEYETPHYRYYTALNEQTARDMFTATCEESLVGANVDVLEVVEIKDPDTECCDDGSCSC